MTHSFAAGALTRRRLLLGGLAAAGGAAPWRVAAQEEGEPSDGLSNPQAIEIRARALPHFQRSRPDANRFGGLEYRGGLVLTSPSEHFGGWSGLVMSDDGRLLLAVSDAGSWLTANVEYDGSAPTALARARIGPLRAVGARPLQDKREQDADSVALLDGSLERRSLLIAFGRVPGMGRVGVRDGEVQRPCGCLGLRAQAKRMPANQGCEAVTVIRAAALKGSVVAFA